IAHISLSLKLATMGYDLRTDAGELHVYLTNALEATQPGQQEARVQVVLGNPPYANSGMLNKNPWIHSLLADYKRDLHEQKLNLDDDCIKFIRLGQWRIQQANSGILAFITNRTYLEGITHRRMRQSLLETFSAIYILDLHGGSRERPPANDTMKDGNIFDIQQGVAIGIFVRKPEWTPGMAEVYHADLWGSRASKYARLVASDLTTTSWMRLEPQPAHYFFVPQQFERQSEWQACIPLTSIFPVFSTGIKTHLDAVLVGDTDAQVAGQVDSFVEMHERDEPARRGSASHKAALLKSELLAHPGRDLYRDYAYRPFDIRRIVYQPAAIEAGDHRFPVMRHVLGGSMLLATTRQLSRDAFSHVFVSNTLTDMCLLSTATRECAYCFPLYLYPASTVYALAGDPRRPNLAPWFVADLATRLGMTYISDGKGDLRETFGPEDIFNYTYALLHAPGYRSRYAAFLKIDFPRLLLPTQPTIFRQLCDAGEKLVSLHLLQAHAPDISGYPVEGTDIVEDVHYTSSEHDARQGRVWINATQYFDGVPRQVWRFELGGYYICHKWLKDRKRRRLSHIDLAHYQRMIAALAETVYAMTEIDEIFHNMALIFPWLSDDTLASGDR
ncbi:MAG: type ISP restriction/modification enzyme, partial [Ktedonobacteraceae bacterium]